MGNWFGNLGLRVQIGAIVVAAVVSLFTIGAIYLLGKARQDVEVARSDAANALNDRVQRLTIDFLQMRRSEKNFILRLDVAEIPRHAEYMRAGRAEVDGLKTAFEAVGRGELVDVGDKIAQGLDAYGAAFRRLSEVWERLGLDPSKGLQGSLRDAAHAIETEAADLADPRLAIDLLQMRRSEKDYMLRHDAKYIGDFLKRADSFGAVLRAADLSAEKRAKIADALGAYRKGFGSWVDADRAVGSVSETLMTVHRGLEPQLDGLAKTSAEIAAAAQAEAAAAVVATERTMAWTFAAVVVVLVAAAGLIARSIARDLGTMTAAMTRLAGGDLTVAVEGVERTNELGHMARAVLVFRDTAQERVRLEAASAAEKARAEAHRRDAMIELAAEFERRVGGIVTAVSSAAAELEAAAETLSASAEEVSTQSVAVAGASEEAATNVQSVAAATEELNATVHEVGRQVSTSASIATKAAGEAEATRERVNGLSDAALHIGSIVELIQEIAAKTNLLALNATIEAARAGEAGRGFAIVAQEVKGLASQTAQATSQIGAQVQSIQGSTREAADAISAIGRTIGEMNGIAGAIAAAVEEQGATTREIARNLGQAASGAADVSANVAGVSAAASSSSAASAQVLSAAGGLSEQAEMLRGAVDRFLSEVRAA